MSEQEVMADTVQELRALIADLNDFTGRGKSPRRKRGRIVATVLAFGRPMTGARA